KNVFVIKGLSPEIHTFTQSRGNVYMCVCVCVCVCVGPNTFLLLAFLHSSPLFSVFFCLYPCLSASIHPNPCVELCVCVCVCECVCVCVCVCVCDGSGGSFVLTDAETPDSLYK